MYKLFEQVLLEDKYGDLQYVWEEIGKGYSKLEFSNIQKKLPEGKYMFADCHEFTKSYSRGCEKAIS